MALSWNEIKDRAVSFSKEWAGTFNEDADAKPFLEAFFNVFGISRKRVGLFEHKVKKINDADGYIDLLWKGVILVEMKSLGKNLDKAFVQARDYTHGLKEHEVPKYILVSDFNTVRLFDTEENKTVEFLLKDLVSNVQHFGFIAGYQKHTYKEQDSVNIQAAELMGKLHDKLKIIGYHGHPLELYLVRLLFCLFADDTTIFEKDIFKEYIDIRTSEDGSDLASKLSELFYILNTPRESRLTIIDEGLNAFPYINGKLFEETLPPAAFDSQMRRILLECCGLNWGTISPAIFGSMFQSVMNPTERRNLGAHYTSEKNILKLIKPLFLDDLWLEFETIKSNKNKLVEFHKKLSKLKFLDPACGCGNFLVITYRELRLLEIQILRAMNKTGTGFLDVREIIWLDVDMMCGIEYEEFPARIAEVAMWLIDHQMNMAISMEFGQYFVRLPLKKAAAIVHGNAIRTNWEEIVPKNELSYILGNPPFIGKSLISISQKTDMEMIFGELHGAGVLDYVSAWYVKAAQFIRGSKIKVAFVSTNSITQGEQVGVLWNVMFSKYDIKIHFAYRTFKWGNEARGNAAVHVVIIGFANFDIPEKRLFEFQDIKGLPHETKVKNINPYLVEGREIIISTRKKPICNVPEMLKGSQPTDNGHLLMSDSEKEDYVRLEPQGEQFIKPFISAKEFLNNQKRWCFWLVKADPTELKHCPILLKRIDAVQQFRLKSTKAATVKWAQMPGLFTENRQPTSDYILIPRHSSENRKYIPFGFFSKDNIIADSCNSIPNAKIFHFGIISSKMHMVWIQNVCGRIKSDYRYSNDIVYNNFPWPGDISLKQTTNIELTAQRIIDLRKWYHGSLADLYDPLTMPRDLFEAHKELDKAVDLAYRPQPFVNDMKRIEFLFELYEKYVGDLFTAPKRTRKVN